MTDDPQALGPYRIVRRVGVGGMGVVFEAVHTGLDKRVALKVLPRALAAGRLDRFLREARTAAALHHTNIVPVFDVGQVDGVPYFAMQYIDGRPLGAAADRGTRSAEPAGTKSFAPPTDATAEYAGASDSRSLSAGEANHDPRGPAAADVKLVVAQVLQAAEGLAYAHQRGVVHRDIKPANLLVDSLGVVWVADFGLAFRADDPTLTTDGAIIGTPRYMSPEQARGEKTDARTDVYSLGVTLYELLTGTAAFPGDTPIDVIQKVITHTPPPPRALDRRVSRDLETVVLKAISKRREDRYATGREFADDLRRFLAGEPVKARRIGAVGRAWRWSKRNPAVASLLATVLLVFALGAGVSAYYAQQAARREGEAKRNADEATEEKRKVQAFERANRRVLYAAQMSLAGFALSDGNFERAAELLRATYPRPGEDDCRGWEWHTLFRRVFPEMREWILPEGEAIEACGSERILTRTAGAPRTVAVYDAGNFQKAATVAVPENLSVRQFDPHGRWLVCTTTGDTHLVLLATADGKEVARWPFDKADAPLLCFGPDDQVAVRGRLAGDDTLQIYDVTRKEFVRKFGGPFPVRPKSEFGVDGRWGVFGPGSETFAAWDARKLHVWDVKTGDKLHESAFPLREYDKDRSELSGLPVALGRDRLIAYWTASDKPSDWFVGKLADVPRRDLNGVLVSAVTPTGPGSLKIYSPQKVLQFSSTSDRLAVSLVGEDVEVYDVTDARPAPFRKFEVKTNQVLCDGYDYSAEDEFVLWGRRIDQDRHFVRAWSFTGWPPQPKPALPGSTGTPTPVGGPNVEDISFSPGDRWLIRVVRGGQWPNARSAELWDRAKEKRLTFLEDFAGRSQASVEWAEDGKRALILVQTGDLSSGEAAVAGYAPLAAWFRHPPSLRVLEPETGRVVGPVPLVATEGQKVSVRFTRGGWVLETSDTSWAVRDPATLAVLLRSAKDVASSQQEVTHDGRLITLDETRADPPNEEQPRVRTLAVWDIATRTRQSAAKLDVDGELAIDPHGKWVAGRRKTRQNEKDVYEMRVLEVANPERPVLAQPCSADFRFSVQGAIHAAANRMAVAFGQDVWVLDATTFAVQQTFRSDRDISEMRFTADGRLVAHCWAGSSLDFQHSTVIAWELETKTQVLRLATRSGDGWLTNDFWLGSGLDVPIPAKIVPEAVARERLRIDE